MTTKFSVGIYLDDLGPSEQAYYAIKRANELQQNSPNNVDVTLFYNNMATPCIKPICAVCSSNELWAYKGMVITTNINNSITLSKIPTRHNKVFYVYDLEWIRPASRDFLHNVKGFDESIKVVARSSDHVFPIENYSNRKVNAIVERFDIQLMIGMFYEK